MTKSVGVIEFNKDQIEELKRKPKRDLVINERVFLLELQVEALQRDRVESRLINKELQEWLKQFPDESRVILKNSRLVLIMQNGEEWECTNYIMQ